MNESISCDGRGSAVIINPYPRQPMSHAIIRGKSGRRHEVDFTEEPIRVEIHASEETVEIVVETDEHLPGHRRRFALINIPRHLFSQATAESARRTTTKLQRDNYNPESGV